MYKNTRPGLKIEWIMKILKWTNIPSQVESNFHIIIELKFRLPEYMHIVNFAKWLYSNFSYVMPIYNSLLYNM